LNYYQHHIGDFNNATRHLTRIERSVYRDLIDLYYDKETPVPTDVERTFKLVLAQTDEEKAAVVAVLAEFFTLTDEGYRQSRCEAEIAEYRTKLQQASNAGKASAAKRLNKKRTVVGTVVQLPFNGRSTDVVLTSNQEPVTNIKKQAKKPSGFLLSEFLETCKANNEPAISAYKPLWDYTEKVGIPKDWVVLAWRMFRRKFADDKKRYIDWRQTFRNYVENNWLKLWTVDASGQVLMTNLGFAELNHSNAEQEVAA
jgi:uncharacterized protein YdaU (DUF1376 family)